jgi:GT2 family glycosyltransferase
MKFNIVITAKNCLEYTIEAIKSIKTSHKHDLIIINDHSTDNTKQWLKDFEVEASTERHIGGKWENLANTESIMIIQNPDIDSLAGKWNLAMDISEMSGKEAVLICNNDILFAPFTIDRLVERLSNAEDSIGMVTANNRRDNLPSADLIFTLEPPVIAEEHEQESPDFSCYLMRISAWHKIGKFDTNYKPAYFEDNDTHSMMKIYGIKALNLPYAPYYHYGSKTQNSVRGGVCTPPQFVNNRRYFIRKFGSTPEGLNIERAKKRLGIEDD